MKKGTIPRRGGGRKWRTHINQLVAVAVVGDTRYFVQLVLGIGILNLDTINTQLLFANQVSKKITMKQKKRNSARV
jgi:hypothetical protein